MPYIDFKNRKSLDPLIDQLAERIVEESKKRDEDAAFAGLVNYSVTRLALKVLRLRFGAMRYWMIATLTGTFHNIADEFYRRLAIPYEEKQIEKNGDVDVYEEFLEDIEKL